MLCLIIIIIVAVSIKPIIDSSKKCANIPIVDEAGNSEIGFQMESVPVDYGSCLTCQLASY